MRLNYIISALIVAIFFAPLIIDLYVDYLWFSEVGYASIFITILKSRVYLFLAASIFFFVFAFLNIRQAIKNSFEDQDFTKSNLLVAGLFGLFMGIIAAFDWDVVLRYLYGVPFNDVDPIFGNDIGFYFFTLPFYQFIKNYLLFGAIIILLIVLVAYFFFSGAIVKDDYGRFGLEFPIFNEASISHLYILGGLIFLLASAGYVLDRYSILYSTRGVVYGAGYADANFQLPLLMLTAAVSLLTALAFFVSARVRDIRIPIAGIALLIVVSTLSGATVNMVQHYKVAPDEYNLEKPFLLYNIKATRVAYGIDDIKEVEFPANYNLTQEDIERNHLTMDNIRLWDWRPLMRAYEQLQLIRTYYDFNDIDIDRYTINGDYKQTMLSMREINPELLPERTWINEHLVFTHGYGVAMTPVREVSREGLPAFYIKDIPPKSAYFNISRPEIYYGELTQSYAIVKTTTEEFDYPKGEENIYTSYEGEGGIPLSSLLRKAAVAMRFNTLKLLVSDSITPESRIMFYRDILNRVNVIAPFLAYDSDPYMVVSDGKLYWIIDAYTISDRYPYSEPYSSDLNYIRNSVKVVIDAYNGNVFFYVVDKEPIIETYMKIFPGVFLPFSEMPEELKSHVRYPEDLFIIQTSKYATYHMQDPRVFYNKEDMWDVPNEIYEGSKVEVEPYYLITKLPGMEEEEFILLLPFTPRAKNNMIAWIAARGDQKNYGEKLAYMFPKDKLVYGPLQIEARIDQDPDISQLFTLWSQAGSGIIRGNLLAIPIEDSLLYVEPIYLKAKEEGTIPELKRVIVAIGDKLTMQETLEKCLDTLFGKAPQAIEIQKERTISNITIEALAHYEKAQEYLKAGNWAGYGEEIKKMEDLLRELKGKAE